MDWRPEALRRLLQLGYDGTVFIPIPEHRFNQGEGSTAEFAKQFSNAATWTPDEQVTWECQAREMADIVVCWVPRVIDRTQPDLNAQQELREETGLLIEDVQRFKHVNTRQLAATFSTPRANVYAVELTEQEFVQLRETSAAGLPLGELTSSGTLSGEQTYVEVASLADVFELPVDYSTLGMVVEGLRVLGLLRTE